MPRRLRIGVDACVLIEAVLYGGCQPDYPAVRIFEIAKKKAFRVFIPAKVEDEARAALRSSGLVSQLDVLLSQCDVMRCGHATEEQKIEYKASIWAYLKDEPDADIGVALRATPKNRRPDYFVSSNKHDWRPNPELDKRLGGVLVRKSKQFAVFITKELAED